MANRVRYTLGLVLVVGAVLEISISAQWPQFRGPNGSGIDPGSGYPVAFSPSKNVAWKAAVPYGQSSPVVAGELVYLTASDGDGRLTIALDAATGRERWRRVARAAKRHDIYKANDPASPTPAADADGVVVFFPDIGLIAYTPDGKDRWTVPLGSFKSFYGMAASPILSQGLAILVCDQQTGSYVIAVDRKSGQQRWRQERSGADDAYATPMIFQPAAGATQLVVLGSSRLEAYAVETGQPLWHLPVGSNGAMGTVVANGDTLFISTLGTNEPWLPSFDDTLQKFDTDKDGRLSAQELSASAEIAEHFGFLDGDDDRHVTRTEWDVKRAMGVGNYGAIAVRPRDARGQLDEKAVLWRFQKNVPYIPAPLLYRDVFYLVKDGGIITSLDPQSGKVLKEGRTSNAIGEYFASPVAADNKVFLASTEGKITVLRADAQWEVLGVNDLDEPVHATPALSNGRIYVRTKTAMYCFKQ